MRTDETQSVHEVGTMKYFQERTMRHTVCSDIKKDVNGFQDFFLFVGRAYLAAAFTEYFTIDSSTGKPTAHIPPPNKKGANQVEYFEQTTGSFPDRYVLHDNFQEIQCD